MFAMAGLVYGETPVVTSINVNRIGWGGGMVVITGEGFATDAFSQFDPTKGNKVGKIQDHNPNIDAYFSINLR